jgi:N-acetylglutamate synthase-like GNAT family acetyltransferase
MIVIRTPKTKEEFKAYYALRYKILREPLGQPRGSEKDDYEPISYHFMAVDDQTNEIVGVVKLFEKESGIGQYSHIAVADAYQGKGIGRMLIEAVEQKSRELGYKRLGTLTRLTATGFYERCGYQPIGITGVLFGKLQMMWMEKDLS